MKLDFSGQTALVTGATGGIGEAIARGFLDRGARVVITTTSVQPAWTKDYSNIEIWHADFTVDKEAQEIVAAIKTLPRLDILVNNAGSLIPGCIDDLKLEDWRTAMTINLEVPMRFMQAAAGIMKSASFGRILNISSIAAFVNRPGVDSYAAAKSALIGLSRAAAMDLAADGILVNALCPGHTHTPMMDRMVNAEQQNALRALIPLGRFAAVQEIAYPALFLCSRLNTYITAQAVIVDGGVMVQ